MRLSYQFRGCNIQVLLPDTWSRNWLNWLDTISALGQGYGLTVTQCKTLPTPFTWPTSYIDVLDAETIYEV